MEPLIPPSSDAMNLSKSVPAVSAALLLSASSMHATPAEDLIAQGDVYYDQLDAQQALKFYLPAEKLDPENVTLLVHISREYRHLMGDATNPAEKLRLGGLAVGYAKRAAALGPDDPDAQLAVAISYGKLQPQESNAERLETARIIKTEVDKALKLNPNSDLAWHVLGRWDAGFAEITGVKRALAELMYGKLPEPTYEDAARCFERAIALKPDRLMHYIELGCVYAQMGRTDDARRLINQGLAMKETEKDDPETKRRGEEELVKLRGG
jgi:tetratricopeptide (TPR) repeat protein